jgi:hypothetical protein
MNDIKQPNIWYKKDVHWNLETKKFKIVTKPKMIFKDMKGLQKPIEF